MKEKVNKIEDFLNKWEDDSDFRMSVRIVLTGIITGIVLISIALLLI